MRHSIRVPERSGYSREVEGTCIECQETLDPADISALRSKILRLRGVPLRSGWSVPNSILVTGEARIGLWDLVTGHQVHADLPHSPLQ